MLSEKRTETCAKCDTCFALSLNSVPHWRIIKVAIKGKGSSGLNEWRSDPKFGWRILLRKNKKKHPLRPKNNIIALKLILFLHLDLWWWKYMKIISAKENIWLTDPKKPKLTIVNKINKLKVFCLFTNSI